MNSVRVLMEKLKVSIVLEILGRPADHVNESLKQLVEKLRTEKGVKVTNHKFYEAAPIENSNEMFSAFTEIDAEFDSISNYFGIIFAYMPSHIEIINPEKIIMSNIDLGNVGNILLSRLHNYDAIAKRFLVDTNFIMEKMKEFSPETHKKISALLKRNPKEDSSPQN